MEALIWPSTVAVIAIVAMLIFKKPISEFIVRIQQIDRSGIKAPSQESRVNESSESDKNSRTFSDFMDSGTSPMTKRHEKSLREDLAKIKTENDEEKITLLIRALVRQQLKTTYNNINNVIFGSQLDLLTQVNSFKLGVKEKYIHECFEKAKKGFPEFHAPTTYESYSGFLFRSGLLIRESENIEISDLGLDFLKYLVDSSLAYKRRG